MDLRFITKRIHAYLDYPVAFTLMVAPFLFGLGKSNPIALWFAVGTGAVAFILTLLTDHHLGVFRVLPYWLHLAADFAVGITFLAVPFIFGLKGLDAWFYWANGAAVVCVVGLHKPEKEPLAAPNTALAVN